MEDTVVFFLTQKGSNQIISPLLLISKNLHVTSEKPKKENKQFKETKTWISYSFLIRKSFNDIVVNLCMESLEIAHGDPLNGEVVDQGIDH